MRANEDAGSALVEFVIVAVTLLVPLGYLLMAAATVHSAVTASTAAVREAGRAFTLAPSPDVGRAHAVAAARVAFADQGVDLPEHSLAIRCEGGACLSPGSVVEVAVDWRLRLPWVPALVDSDRLSFPISAVQRIPVDDFRSSQAA